MMQATRYRLYVDESGDDVMDPAKWSSPESRYLGLTGVAIANETYRTRTHPEFEALKQNFFPHNPNEPLVLVRHEIVNKREAFRILQDPEVAAHWENRIIQFLDEHVSQVITVVLDKETYRRGGHSAAGPRPYSYCLNTLTERYGQWLNRVGGIGNVTAESRGKKEDRNLKADFQRFIAGADNPPAMRENLRSVSSSQIQLNLKADNIAGLQLADLLAYPGRKGVLLENGRPLYNPTSPSTMRFIEAFRAKSHPHSGLLP